MSEAELVSKKNNINHEGEHYVLFEFVYKYLTPAQLLQMGIDDYAEIIKESMEEEENRMRIDWELLPIMLVFIVPGMILVMINTNIWVVIGVSLMCIGYSVSRE